MSNPEKKASSNNYILLQNLLNDTAIKELRKQYREKWKSKSGTEWQNSEEIISNFKKYFANIYKCADKMRKKVMDAGDIDKWDLPLLIDCLKCLENESFKSQTDNERITHFNSLKEMRNKMAHWGGVHVDAESFEIMQGKIKESLLALGMSEAEFEDVRREFSKITLDNSKESAVSKEDEETKRKIEILKGLGDTLYKNGDFGKAIKMYSDAVRLAINNPSKELAILYSNRSAAFLKFDHFYDAKDDARAAIHIQPTWCKGNFRLAQAYEFAEKYEKALECFETALKLEPSDEKLKNERDSCRHMVAKRKRAEHLDPHNHVKSYEEMAKECTKKYGISTGLTATLMEMAQNDAFELGLPDGICGEGLKYLMGYGVNQSFEMAAKCFAKAASLGFALGIYNLANLTMEGKGVQKNVPEAIRLYGLAASQDIMTDFKGQKILNIGVAEAEHALGLCYSDGVGVPQNYKTALHWYTRAIQHGEGLAANNIGTMYHNGQGVEPNFEKAIQYYKLSSHKKVVRAMENLANLYMDMFDLKNAEKWYRFAISNGSLALQSQTRFQICSILASKKPFKEDIFELELLEEIKNGPLKHLLADPKSTFIDATFKNLKEIGTEKMSTSRKELGLSDPYRLSLIKSHRENFSEMRSPENKNKMYAKGNANLLPKPMVDLFRLKPIHFCEMNPKEDHIYEGFAIKLTFIEDAVLGKPSIMQLVEDENGDTHRIFIYNFPQNKETHISLGFGCKLTLVNPYLRLTKEGGVAIRVDDISLMILQSNLQSKQRCRYCGQENDHTVPCRKCRRSFYCSKLCLKKDATELNHQYVCVKHL